MVMSKKWSDPIDKLLDADQKARSLSDYINDIEKAKSESEIFSIDPNKITLWKYKDRPQNELGDIDLLAKKMLDIGQQQPCIVRPNSSKKDCYELIAGERRWRAATKASINLKVVIKDLSDNEAAIVQEEENSYNPLSEFAQGMSYFNQIKAGVLRQVDLIEKLGISKQKLSRLLSYSQIPTDVCNAIGDMRNVSSGTAEKIKQLCGKGNPYKNCIIALADKIRLGKMGHEKLSKLVEDKISNTKPKEKTKKIYDNNGTFLFSARKNYNNGIAININKKVIHSIKYEILTKELISTKIIEVLQDALK